MRVAIQSGEIVQFKVLARVDIILKKKLFSFSILEFYLLLLFLFFCFFYNTMAEDSAGSSSEGEDGFSIFTEPADFRPPAPPPTQVSYQLPVSPNTTIQLTLVGSHPLWAHHLWNASPTLSNYLCQDKPQLCLNKNVLELGAAAGLPSIVAHILGAKKVVSTDYPDAQLTNNLQRNFDNNIYEKDKSNCVVEGYIWGSDTKRLKAHLDSSDQQYFDLLLLSDLIFNHQAHGGMLDTMNDCLPSARSSSSKDRDGPQALIFFTHHRPHLADKDMSFFQLAQQRGWTCSQVGTWKMPPMFPNDPGNEEVRGTVHGWQVYR